MRLPNRWCSQLLPHHQRSSLEHKQYSYQRSPYRCGDLTRTTRTRYCCRSARQANTWAPVPASEQLLDSQSVQQLVHTARLTRQVRSPRLRLTHIARNTTRASRILTAWARHARRITTKPSQTQRAVQITTRGTCRTLRLQRVFHHRVQTKRVGRTRQAAHSAHTLSVVSSIA